MNSTDILRLIALIILLIYITLEITVYRYQRKGKLNNHIFTFYKIKLILITIYTLTNAVLAIHIGTFNDIFNFILGIILIDFSIKHL